MNVTAMYQDLFITLRLDAASYPTGNRIQREMVFRMNNYRLTN
jgi:hypothetical protein